MVELILGRSDTLIYPGRRTLSVKLGEEKSKRVIASRNTGWPPQWIYIADSSGIISEARTDGPMLLDELVAGRLRPHGVLASNHPYVRTAT
jgi:hypothetical protein